jgi:hypothetical protein
VGHIPYKNNLPITVFRGAGDLMGLLSREVASLKRTELFALFGELALVLLLVFPLCPSPGMLLEKSQQTCSPRFV